MKTYKIAGILFSVEGTRLEDSIGRILGFSTFDASDTHPQFKIEEASSPSGPLDNCIYFVKADGALLENGITDDGKRWFSITDGNDRLMYMADLKANEVQISGVFRMDLLKSALWNTYGMMTAGFGRVPIHSSCVTVHGKAYLFLGESGTGKSTHSRMWIDTMDGCELLNDDSPIIEIAKSGIYAWGSPWSGKTACYQNVRVPLDGIIRLHQSSENKIKRLDRLHALGALYPSFPPGLTKDRTLWNSYNMCLSSLIANVPVYSLGCRPDRESAIICQRALSLNVI